MKYLQFYCDSFDLTIQKPYVLDSDKQKVGKVTTNEKYIQFYAKHYPMKISDLLMLGIERISVHD